MIIRLPRESTLFLLLGLFLQFNVIPAVYGIPLARASDGIALLIFAWYAVFRGGYRRVGTLVPLIAVALIAALAFALKQSPADGDHYNGLVFAIYLLIAVEALRNDPDRLLTRFVIGTLIGFILSLVVLALQVAVAPMLRDLGLVVDTSGFDARSAQMALTKPGGMWSNGNETGHVYALAGAAAMFLSLRYRHAWLYPAYYLALLLSFGLTLNRAGIVAPTVGLVFWCAAFANNRNILAVVGAVLMLALPSALLLASGLGDPVYLMQDTIIERLVGDEHVARNLAQRVESFGAGASLLVQHPFGIGYAARVTMMSQLTSGVQSPHNAFIAFGFQLGLVVPVLFAASAIAVTWARNRVHPYLWLSLVFGGPSLFFEELSINQPFMFLAGSTMAAAWWLLWRHSRGLISRAEPASTH